ncbi:MAG: haloacid dehalogenase type II [Alphaproteobacteria bacterium]|nr:haloacid dehalogenase type II [Alphaproteobacteria bacterium]
MKALLFDIFGTVVDWRTGIIRAGEAFGAAHGVSLDWPQFADDWRALYQPAMERVRSGGRAFVKLDTLHRENLDTVLARHGVTGIPEPALADLNFAWRRLPPWPDSVSGLTRLKTRYILGTLSNGNISLMVNLAKYGGLPWDVILGAEVAQAYKPTPESYLRSAAALDLPPEEVALVAAHNNDLQAARTVGYKTIFVPRPTEHGPGQTIDLEPAEDWDLVVEDLNDAADKLGC